MKTNDKSVGSLGREFMYRFSHDYEFYKSILKDKKRISGNELYLECQKYIAENSR